MTAPVTTTTAPSVAARVVVAVLAVMAVGVGALYLWSTATGLLVAGLPSWAIGLVVVGLIVALAFAVNRVVDPRP